MWWKSSVWSIWRSRIGVEQIGSRCSFFVQKNIQRKLLKGGRIMKSSTFERLSCVMTRSHRFELCRRPRCSFLGWFRQVSCSTCANVNTCNLRKNHNDHPSCHRQLFQMMVFGQTISMMATPYAYITYIYIYLHWDLAPNFMQFQAHLLLKPEEWILDSKHFISRGKNRRTPFPHLFVVFDSLTTGTAVDGERLSWRLSILG